MADDIRVFSGKTEKMIADILARAIKDEKEGLFNLAIRNKANQLLTFRGGSNPSYDIGKSLAYNPVAAVSKPIGRLYRESERFAGVMSGSGFSGQTKGGTLADMRKFYARQERIGDQFKNYFKVSAGEGISTTEVHSPDETWMYQLGLARSGVSDDFSYLRDQEKEDKAFLKKIDDAKFLKAQEDQRRYMENLDFARGVEAKGRRNKLSGDAAYRFDTMSDYERDLHVLKKKYGGGKQGIERANEIMRKNVLKELPAFFRNSKASTKDLYKIRESITKGGKFRAFKGAAAPVAIGVGIGQMVNHAIESYLSSVDKANEKKIAWENGKIAFGGMSQKFQTAAYLAGISDPRKQQELYAKLTTRYGDADMIANQFGRMTAGLNAKERMFFMQSQGISPEELALFSLYSGNGMVKPSKARMMNAKVAAGNLASVYLASSDSGVLDQVTGIFGSSSYGARLGEGSIDARLEKMLKNQEAARSAALSADRYDAGDYAVATADTGSAAGGGNSTVTLILKTEDGKTVGKRVMKAGEKFTDRVAVADFFDKGE